MSEKENDIPANASNVQIPSTAIQIELKQDNNIEPDINDPQFLCALRKIVFKIYTVDLEIPTLPKILIEAHNQLNFTGSKSLLRKILKAKLGFKYKRCKYSGPVPVERQRYTLARNEYLIILSKNNYFGINKQQVIYIDETLIYLDEKAKDPNDVWCIMHAGGEQGFLDGAGLVYKCMPKKKAHNLIGKKKFLKWLRQKLMPNLPANSIIVLDNALQHNEPLIMIPPDSTRESLIDWLQKHEIDFSADLLHDELLELVKKNIPQNNYAADNILMDEGHTALRLPIYCELSPLDNIWGIVIKQVYERHGKEPDVPFDRIIEEAISSVKSKDWEIEMRKIKLLENEYYDSAFNWDNESELRNFSFEESGSEVSLFESSDADYDTDFNATDDSDDNSISSDGSYVSIHDSNSDKSETNGDSYKI